MYWQSGLSWDVRTSFTWGFDERFEEDNISEAVTFNFSPFWDLYGYFSSYVELHFPYGMLGVNFYFQPTEAHLLHFDLSFPKNNSHYPICWGAKIMQTGVHTEVGVTVGWPSCDIGLLDTLFGSGTEGQGCHTVF